MSDTTPEERASWRDQSGHERNWLVRLLNDFDQQAARIAELEDALGNARHLLGEMDARIAELEAERDRFAALAETLPRATARIAELEADYARAEDITKRAHAVAKRAMERIAELEAERDKAVELWKDWKRQWELRAHMLDKCEAERDRLKSALTEIAGMADITLNVGPAIRCARAALTNVAASSPVGFL